MGQARQFMLATPLKLLSTTQHNCCGNSEHSLAVLKSTRFCLNMLARSWCDDTLLIVHDLLIQITLNSPLKPQSIRKHSFPASFQESSQIDQVCVYSRITSKAQTSQVSVSVFSLLVGRSALPPLLSGQSSVLEGRTNRRLCHVQGASAWSGNRKPATFAGRPHEQGGFHQISQAKSETRI